MGYRLHIRTVNKIEYGPGLFSADTSDEVTRIMREHFGDDIWSDESESTFEIPKGDFLDGIASFRELSEDEFAQEYPNLVKLGYTKDKFADTLQGMYDSADPNNDEITFDWF